eukprot:CAMPEP_0179259422 /NCGR_PEP_ID=MMETSP0797-20121207/25818_1 /TAXON_ID=47934 /ORGANISM="Dinophysis acuminata, Strain DAEP01" /LENGTH=563 /DNA_ID=CAMNT_0020967475 /DNA_START=57 /DNA_END=1748 /DNA_ORIENTATION=-
MSDTLDELARLLPGDDPESPGRAPASHLVVHARETGGASSSRCEGVRRRLVYSAALLIVSVAGVAVYQASRQGDRRSSAGAGRRGSWASGSGRGIIGSFDTLCNTTGPGERCWDAVQHARTRGVLLSPAQYPGLGPSSSVEEFQEFLHSRPPHDKDCPRLPCVRYPPAARVSCAAPTVAFYDSCHTASEGEPCFEEAEWARRHGIREHPEWYPKLTPLSTLPEFQAEVHRSAPTKCPQPCAGAESGTCVCAPPKVLAADGGGGCQEPEGMQAMTFYMYRAQSAAEYPLENANAADLAGVLWYLHNEIVGSTPRKYGVIRILRYKMTMKNTAEYYRAYNKQFGPFVAFDNAMCTTAGCDSIWLKYGFIVGCQNLGRTIANYADEFQRRFSLEAAARAGPGNRSTTGAPPARARGTSPAPELPSFPTATSTTATATRAHLHGGVWYSLPGHCPAVPHVAKTPECQQLMPGGRCAHATGQKTCTYSAELAGEVHLDELAGIANYTHFWLVDHNAEYDARTDKGRNCSFWDGKHDLEACAKRMRRVEELFRKRYPEFPDTFEAPPCN